MPEVPEDLGTITYAVALPVEHVRALVDTEDEIREQYRAHVIGMAAYLRTTGATIDTSRGVVGLKASEQRRYDKRAAATKEIRALIPSERATTAPPPTISADYAARVLALEV